MRPVVSILRRLTHRVGRRGVSLLFVALLATVFAVSLADPSVQQTTAFGQIIPISAWIIAWAVTGVTCLIQAFMRTDRVAFAFAVGMVTAWAAQYLDVWLSGDVPRGWLAVGIYAALAGWLAVISTWPEALRVPSALDDTYPDAVVTADASGRIIGWQGAARKMFGWTAEQITGKPLTDLMPERYRQQHLAGMARVVAEGTSKLAGKTVEVEGLHQDGHEFPAQLSVAVYLIGDVLTVSAVVRERGETQ